MTDQEHSDFPAIAVVDIGGMAVQTVDARELHARLKVGSAFKDWIARRIADYGFEDGKDFCSYLSESDGGRPSKEYSVSIDMAKELAMVERTDEGKRVRQYFLEMERRAKDPMSALRDPAAMRGLLLSYSEKVLALEARVEADTPKAAFYDAFINADGLYGLQNAARALNCRPNLFIRWLKENFLFYQGGNLVARVQHIQSGAFEVKSTIVDDKVRPQAFVTPKGLKYLSDRIPPNVRLGAA